METKRFFHILQNQRVRGAIINLAHFYKIKYSKITRCNKISLTKVVLLFTYWDKKIIFRKIQQSFYVENWLWKSIKCQILKASLHLILQNVKKCFGPHKYGPQWLHNFEGLAWKLIKLNYSNTNPNWPVWIYAAKWFWSKWVKPNRGFACLR